MHATLLRKYSARYGGGMICISSARRCLNKPGNGYLGQINIARFWVLEYLSVHHSRDVR